MDEQKQPGIKTEAIILLESNFIRYPVYADTIEPTVELSYTASMVKKDKWHGVLCANVSCLAGENSDKVFEARIRYLGVFNTDPDNANLEIDKFMDYHAPAHLYPYLREYLTSLSTRSGLPAIILPPLNMAALRNIRLDGTVKDDTIEAKLT